MDEVEYITFPDDWIDYNPIPTDYIFVARPPVVDETLMDYVPLEWVQEVFDDADGFTLIVYYRWNQRVFSVMTFTLN